MADAEDLLASPQPGSASRGRNVERSRSWQVSANCRRWRQQAARPADRRLHRHPRGRRWPSAAWAAATRPRTPPPATSRPRTPGRSSRPRTSAATMCACRSTSSSCARDRAEPCARQRARRSSDKIKRLPRAGDASHLRARYGRRPRRAAGQRQGARDAARPGHAQGSLLRLRPGAPADRDRAGLGVDHHRRVDAAADERCTGALGGARLDAERLHPALSRCPSSAERVALAADLPGR